MCVCACIYSNICVYFHNALCTFCVYTPIYPYTSAVIVVCLFPVTPCTAFDILLYTLSERLYVCICMYIYTYLCALYTSLFALICFLMTCAVNFVATFTHGGLCVCSCHQTCDKFQSDPSFCCILWCLHCGAMSFFGLWACLRDVQEHTETYSYQET